VSRPWLVITLVIYGVVAAISMIILGWPESTPAQVALLELAPLPLQGSLAVGLWFLSRRMRPLGRRGRVVWWIVLGIAAIGLALVGLAYLGPRGLVPLGLSLVWVALLLAMVLVVSHLPRRTMRELFRVVPDEDEADEGVDLLDDADDVDDSGDATAELNPAAS
jgi:hypothetical protein